MRNKEDKERNKVSFSQKLKDAWANKSVRGLFIAFLAVIVFTVLKLVFKF